MLHLELRKSLISSILATLVTTINTHHHGSDGHSVGWLENGQRTVTPAAAIGVGVAPESGALVVDAAS